MSFQRKPAGGVPGKQGLGAGKLPIASKQGSVSKAVIATNNGRLKGGSAAGANRVMRTSARGKAR